MNPLTTQEIRRLAREVRKILGYTPERIHYSGRGMFGRPCSYAFRVPKYDATPDSPAGNAFAELGLGRESLGHDIVWYTWS